MRCYCCRTWISVNAHDLFLGGVKAVTTNPDPFLPAYGRVSTSLSHHIRKPESVRGLTKKSNARLLQILNRFERLLHILHRRNAADSCGDLTV